TDINYFYQLGVEARPTDADGKARRVEIRVSRPNATIRAPSQTAAMAPPASEADAIKRALLQPTDVAGLPLEVATYVAHADQPDKVRVMVTAAAADAPGVVPVEWGYMILDGDKIIGGSGDRIMPAAGQPWPATASVEVPPGKYRLRAALIAEDGRVGSLDLPLT